MVLPTGSAAAAAGRRRSSNRPNRKEESGSGRLVSAFQVSFPGVGVRHKEVKVSLEPCLECMLALEQQDDVGSSNDRKDDLTTNEVETKGHSEGITV